MFETSARLKPLDIHMPSLDECLFLDLYHRDRSAHDVMTQQGLSHRITVFPVRAFKDSDVKTGIDAHLKKWPLSPIFIFSETLSEDALGLVRLCLKIHPKTYLICHELSARDSLSMLRIMSDGGETLSLGRFLELMRPVHSQS